MKAQAFNSWLEKNGAQVLPPTNPYEIARFIAHGGTCVVYTNSKGKISANGFALKAVEAFERNQKLDMGFAKTARTVNTKYKAALLKRDGRECFYCGLDMSDEDVTIEHLIALDKGGNNRLENMALAHYECNQKAGNMHLTAKIKLRDTLRHNVTSIP